MFKTNFFRSAVFQKKEPNGTEDPVPAEFEAKLIDVKVDELAVSYLAADIACHLGTS